MAIISTIKDLQRHFSNSKSFLKALAFLEQLDAQRFSVCKGNESCKIPIWDDKVFAMLQQYESRPLEQAKPEAHRKYIDLQYVYKGRELVYWNNMETCKSITDYDEEKDIQWLSMSDFSQVLLYAPLVALFYPNDVHAPCLQYQGKAQIWKCVVKVAMDADSGF